MPTHTHMLTHILMHTHTPTHQEQLRMQKWPLSTRGVDKECLKPWPNDVLCHPTCCVTKSLLLSQTQIYRSRVCMIMAPDSACSQVTISTNLRVRGLSREKAVRGDGVQVKMVPRQECRGKQESRSLLHGPLPWAQRRGVWLNVAEW